MPDPGYLIHEDDVPLLHASLRAFRGGSRNLPPTKRGKQPPPNRPPIVAVLLEDLPSGETADAAVLYFDETSETWEDTGRTERVRSIIPMHAEKTPLIAGLRVVALWLPRVGYGVISAECREDEDDEDEDEY